MDAREVRPRAEGRVHRSRRLPRVGERGVRGLIAQIGQEWAERGRPRDGVDERDSRISVVSVRKKDARKSAGQVREKYGCVTGRIDSVQRVLERRKGIEL